MTDDRCSLLCLVLWSIRFHRGWVPPFGFSAGFALSHRCPCWPPMADLDQSALLFKFIPAQTGRSRSLAGFPEEEGEDRGCPAIPVWLLTLLVIASQSKSQFRE